MPLIRFASHLNRHLGCQECQVAGATVAQALAGACAIYPRLRSYVLEDDGAVRHHVAIFVNSQTIADRKTLSDPVGPADEIDILQALSGG